MARRFALGVPEIVFGVVLASVLVGGKYRLLNDPGTLWHLRLGREILASGDVPRIDTLTFTHGGERWVDQSWLFDAALALIVNHRGWSWAVLISALGLAAIYGSLARWLLRDDRSPLIVLVVALLAAGVGTIHFLIRPHLLTLGFVLVTLRVCQAQHELGGRRVFWLPLLTALWANLHGGFLAGPLIVLTAALGHAVSGPWNSERRRGVATFLFAFLLCLLAALLNPYGFELYRHVGRLLVSSGVTELIEEYQPVPFGKPDARAFEWTLLALVALPVVSTSRMSGYQLAHTLVWLHLSLASVRHAPLFALVAAPGLARLLDGLPHVKSPAPSENLTPCRSLWPAVAGLGLGLSILCGATLGGFDPGRWPLTALPALNRASPDARLFHEQDWGGLIEAESRPLRKSYLDDRFELFGKPGILRYLNVLEGGPEWDQIRDRDGIALVWLRPDRPLARRLARDPSWRVLHKDRISILFERSNPREETHARTVRTVRIGS